MKDRNIWILSILSVLILTLSPLSTEGWQDDLPYSKEGGAPDIYHGPDDPQGDGDADDLSIYSTRLGPGVEVVPHHDGYDPKLPTDGSEETRKADQSVLRQKVGIFFMRALISLWIR